MNMRLWGWPMVLGATSAIGLVSALLADGAWDAVSWLALGLPVAMGLWHGLRRKPTSSRS
jgi:hypothetical protein